MRGRYWAVACGCARAPVRRHRGRRRLARIALLCATLSLGVAACGGGAASPTSAPRPNPTMPAPAATPAATAAPPPTAGAVATATRAATVTRTASPGATVTRGVTNYPSVIRFAIEALARELGLPPDRIIVAEVEARQWSSSALGCPEPGRTYLQVVTPGYRVILVAQGKNYEYHTNEKSMVVRCSS